MADSRHTEIEAQDAKTVDRAAEVLRRLDLAEVERLLRPVIDNTPANYVNEFEEDGTRYVKFWDAGEFMEHSTMRVPPEAARLAWLPNPYPRAHYYMAYIAVERRQFYEALRWLDAAIKLEPTQPRLWLEKALVLAGLGQHAEALSLYQSVLDNAVVLAPSLRAMALRGRGLQLIELGNLDEAEQCFLESLTIDPDSPVARKELEYIEHLRSGGEAAPLETAVWPKSAPLTCAVCGAETLLNAPDGSDKVICESCMQRGSAVLGCGCIANQVLCDGFSVVVVKEPCPAHVADKDVIQQLLPPDPNPTSLVQAGLHALYFGKTGGCESAPPLKYADKILSGLATDKHVLLELFGNDVRHAAVAAMASNIVRRGKQ